MCVNAGTPLPVGEGIGVGEAVGDGDWPGVEIGAALVAVGLGSAVMLGLAVPLPQAETIRAAQMAPKASRRPIIRRVYAPAGSTTLRLGAGTGVGSRAAAIRVLLGCYSAASGEAATGV